MGIPVVVTAADGKEELVENEVDGFIVGSGGHAELARRMILLCNEEYIGSRVAKVARETIQRRFSIECHAREIEGIYEQVVAEKHNERPVEYCEMGR